MDKITDIQRKGGVARVKLLSGEELRIPSALYLERRLRVGEALDVAGYRLFMTQRGYSHALEAAVKYLALRERSEQEVCARLRRSCYDEQTIARVLDTLSGSQLVADSRFAEAWVAHRAKKYGRNRILQELKHKGVGTQEVQRALEDFSPEEELDRAREQARRLQRRIPDKQKRIQALVRRGYAWPLARKAVEE